MQVESGSSLQRRWISGTPAVTALVLCTVGAIAVVAGCQSQPPDTQRRPELEMFYEHLFDEFESRFGRDIRVPVGEGDELARDRLVNAANGLADRVRRDRQQGDVASSYEIELPYLNIIEDPDWDTEFDFEITLTLEELERLGVVEP